MIEVLVLASAPLAFPQEQEKTDAAAVAAIRAAVTRSVKKHRAIMVAVVRGQKVLLAHAEGRVGKERKADATTLFPLGQATRALSNLVFARLHAEKKLDWSAPLGTRIEGFTLKDSDDKPAKASLHALQQGFRGVPSFSNFVPAAGLAAWTARRVVLEHAFVNLRPNRLAFRYGEPSLHRGLPRNTVEYAICQLAAETATGTSWRELVGSHLGKPSKLDGFVIDVRHGLPAAAATLYRKGFLGIPLVESSAHGVVPAATGAWLNAHSLAKVLQQLVVAARGVRDGKGIEALPKKRIEFASFGCEWPLGDGGAGRHHVYLDLEARAPGMSGGIYVFPRQGVAVGAFTNLQSERPGAPSRVLAAAVGQLLPDPVEPGRQWNTAVGLGGGVGGVFQKAIPDERRGRFATRIRLAGKQRRVLLRIDEKSVRAMSLDGGADRRASRTFYALGRIRCSVSGLLPLRADGGCSSELEISWHDASKTWRGVLHASREGYCDATYRVVFEKASGRLAPREGK